jgi:hypothetical protein
MLEIKVFDVTSEIAFKVGLKHLEKKSYDVVFVDTPLDNYTEKQILTSLTKRQIFKKSNVFLFSSVDFNDVELDEWKKEGLYSYLKKPVNRSTIIKALDDVRAKINDISQVSLETVQEPDDEEATPEQLEKLSQLQIQIQELESISRQHLLHQKDSQSEKPIPAVSELISDGLTFKNIINDLRSLQSKFESADVYVEESFSSTDIEQDEFIKKKLKETLVEFSRLKNEIQALDKIDDSESKLDNDSLINEKKSKMTKKLSRTGTKKSSKLQNS